MKFCELRVDAKNNFTPPLQPPHRHTGILCTMTRLELLLKLCTMTIIIKTSLFDDDAKEGLCNTLCITKRCDLDAAGVIIVGNINIQLYNFIIESLR